MRRLAPRGKFPGAHVGAVTGDITTIAQTIDLALIVDDVPV
ncbi:MAG: hypothetical protein ABIR62_15400 [Dokdonella sp.]